MADALGSIVNALEAMLSSPLTVAIATAAGFLLGLIARPFIEAKTSLGKEQTLARQSQQREALMELQTVLEALDPLAPSTDTSRRARPVTERKINVVMSRVENARVKQRVRIYLAAERSTRRDDFRVPSRWRDKGPEEWLAHLYHDAHIAIGTALRKL